MYDPKGATIIKYEPNGATSTKSEQQNLDASTSDAILQSLFGFSVEQTSKVKSCFTAGNEFASLRVIHIKCKKNLCTKDIHWRTTVHCMSDESCCLNFTNFMFTIFFYGFFTMYYENKHCLYLQSLK